MHSPVLEADSDRKIPPCPSTLAKNTAPKPPKTSGLSLASLQPTWKSIYESARNLQSDAGSLNDYAASLGVTSDSLHSIGGIKHTDGRLLIPMKDAEGSQIGTSTRELNGEKKMLFGSKLGLIYASEFRFATDTYTPGPHNWIRTMDAGLNCPVCHKPDGCLLSRENPDDPKAVVCRVVKSEKQQGFGYLHILKEEGKLRTPEIILIVEGASDVAAAMDLGFDAIGRPSNLAGIDLLIAKVRACKRPVVVIGENDKKPDGVWPGRQGMEKAGTALKNAGCNVTMVMPPEHVKDLRDWKNKFGLTPDVLQSHIKANAETPTATEKPSQQSAVMELAKDHPLFLNKGVPHVAVPSRSNRRDIVPVKSDTYGSFLSALAVKKYGEAPPEQTIKTVQRTLAGITLLDKAETPIYQRLAFKEAERKFYLDAGDDAGTYYEIDSSGFAIKNDVPPVYLRRDGTAGIHPLPVLGGSLAELRPLVNVATDADFILFVAFLLAPYIPSGTIPPLGIDGEHGSGKSKLAEIQQRLFDPQLHSPGCQEEESAIPSTERELAVAAEHSAMLVYNNLSGMKPEQADTFCRLASGGRLDSRALYTNSDTVRLSRRLPVILAGISGEIFSRADLRDRMINLHLPSIPNTMRMSEGEFYRRFEEMRPRVFGAILTAVSTALRNLPTTPTNPAVRMGSFVQFVEAAEPSLPWKKGDFLKAYQIDRQNAADTAIELSAVAQVIVAILEIATEWRGSVTDLMAEWDDPRQRQMPECPQYLRSNRAEIGKELSRVLPALRRHGITYESARSGTKRVHIFRKLPGAALQAKGPPVYTKPQEKREK